MLVFVFTPPIQLMFTKKSINNTFENVTLEKCLPLIESLPYGSNCDIFSSFEHSQLMWCVCKYFHFTGEQSQT